MSPDERKRSLSRFEINRLTVVKLKLIYKSKNGFNVTLSILMTRDMQNEIEIEFKNSMFKLNIK